MHASLLATKLRAPPQSRETVPRARLRDILEREIPGRKLVLVSAPAGYGKTTFLAGWARASRFPVAWLSLEQADSGVARFFRYLLAAWEAVDPGVMESRLGTLLGGTSPEREAVLAAFINVADGRSDHTIFVLDDFHLLEGPAIAEALSFLLAHLPPTLHFVLAGRGEPRLPLARYRASGEMLELRAEHLRLRPEESEQFLVDRMGLELDPDTIRALHARMEGWVAGLQLVALSLRRRLTAMERPVVTGRHRFIADYLEEEVLAPLPERVRYFLLESSILDRLCGPLCEAVTEHAGGQEMLESLEREGVFLTPLDDERVWYRYHSLFADVLREAFQRRHPERVAPLHRRAARWHLERELPEAAFRHALAGEDVEVVLLVFERYAQAKLIGGEFTVLQRWLDALPVAWRAAYPLFGLVRTGLLLFTGQLDASVRCIDEVEERLTSLDGDEAQRQRARVSAVRCAIACFRNDLTQAERFADRAAAALQGDDSLFQSLLYGALGDTYRRNGYWREARRCYLHLLDVIEVPHFRVLATHAYGALADLTLRQGALREAARYWRRALDALKEPAMWGRLPLPLTGWVYIRLGELHYEWNALAAAREYLARGLSRAEVAGDVRARIAGYLLDGRLQLAQGEIEAASDSLERAHPLVERAHFPRWSSRFERLQVELWLAQGRHRHAGEWADERVPAGTLLTEPDSDVAQRTLVRALVIWAEEAALERALALLDPMLRQAHEEERGGVTIEALALQALALQAQGNLPAALVPLERALRLAEPEGYVRRFADLGLPMARLLQEARSRAVLPAYVDTLLAACGDEAVMGARVQRVLPEPLTEREEEVLALIAAGLTNREVAEKLVISTETVKKHASNIYGKLGVGSRTEAVARARELALLD